MRPHQIGTAELPGACRRNILYPFVLILFARRPDFRPTKTAVARIAVRVTRAIWRSGEVLIVGDGSRTRRCSIILFLHLASPLANTSKARHRTPSTECGAQDGETCAVPSAQKPTCAHTCISPPDLGGESRHFQSGWGLRAPGREVVTHWLESPRAEF